MNILRRGALHAAGDRLRGWLLGCLLAILAGHPGVGSAQSENVKAIEHVKPSIVAVGTFERLRNPEFRFRGTGFAVGDGSVVATNEHVVPAVLDTAGEEKLAVAVRAPNRTIQVRGARKVASEPSADLVLLKIDGPPLTPLQIGNSADVREGQIYLFTGFPIGTVLGLIPATSRAMISAITPIVIPAARAGGLSSNTNCLKKKKLTIREILPFRTSHKFPIRFSYYCKSLIISIFSLKTKYNKSCFFHNRMIINQQAAVFY